MIPQVLTDILNEGLANDQLWGDPKVFNIPDMKSNASWVGKDVTWIKPGDIFAEMLATSAATS